MNTLQQPATPRGFATLPQPSEHLLHKPLPHGSVQSAGPSSRIPPRKPRVTEAHVPFLVIQPHARPDANIVEGPAVFSSSLFIRKSCESGDKTPASVASHAVPPAHLCCPKLESRHVPARVNRAATTQDGSSHPKTRRRPPTSSECLPGALQGALSMMSRADSLPSCLLSAPCPPCV